MKPLIHQHPKSNLSSVISAHLLLFCQCALKRQMPMRYVFAFVGIMAFNPVSRAQSNPAFVGTWVVDFRTTVQNMSVNQKAAYDSLSDRAKNAFTDSFKSRTFLFKDDYGVVISFQTAGGVKSAEGSWFYDSTAKELSIEAGGVKRGFIVQWLDRNRIVLTYQNTERGSLLKSLCLDRQ